MLASHFQIHVCPVVHEVRKKVIRDFDRSLRSAKPDNAPRNGVENVRVSAFESPDFTSDGSGHQIGWRLNS